jgi:hypothetical protein
MDVTSASFILSWSPIVIFNLGTQVGVSLNPVSAYYFIIEAELNWNNVRNILLVKKRTPANPNDCERSY